MTETPVVDVDQPELPFESASAKIQLGTYFVLGITPDGQPALYLSPQVQDFERDREPDMQEVRRIVDMVSEELRLRTITASVVQAISEMNRPDPSPGERVGQAMAARQEGSD